MLVKGVRIPWWLVLIGGGGAIYAVFKAVFLSPWGAQHVISGIVCLLIIILFVMLMVFGFPMGIIAVLDSKISQRAESILSTLDEGADPESIRGAYIPYPPKLPVVPLRERSLWRPWIVTIWRTQPVTTESTERELPTPWEHKQIYAPMKNEYLASFEALRRNAVAT
ncbi:hypothetical protein B0H12DRAFT_851428 [Mycena haematopus]|nr:hypothetical protein B0H12DRAFT_851428 [Mycena haematopus]